MQLYGNNFSSNSNKVRFAANAMKLDYEFISVDLAAGEQRRPEFLKVNPVGRIPALVDGTFTIFESNAIMRYLAEKTNSPLYPKSLEAHSVINQWLDFCSIHIGGAMGKMFFNTIVHKFVGAPADVNSLEEGRKFLNQFLVTIEAEFNRHAYLGGDQLTLADLNLLSALDPAEAVGYDLSPFPKTIAWRQKLQAEPFYQEVYPSFAEYLGSIMQKA